MNKKIGISILVFAVLILVGVMNYNNQSTQAEEKFEEQKQQEEIEIAMPTYIQNEVANAENRINEISENNDISFSFITDIHGDQEIFAPITNIQAFRKIGTNKLIDFGICAGDITTGRYEDLKSGKTLSDLKFYSNMLKDTDTSVLFARGNHDCNTRQDASVAISGQQYYETLLKDLENQVIFNEADLGGDYYYKDLEDKKVRICVLNAFNGANYEFIFGEKQLEFIKNEMLDLSEKANPNEWQVLFLTHTVDETVEHNEVPSDNQKLYNIINEFQNNGGTVIAIITGHHHIDTTTIKNNLLIITVRSASINYDRAEYNTETFSEEDLCFDIFTIDKDTKTLYSTRVGRGNDRKWSYNINNLKEEQISRERTKMIDESEEDSIKVECIKNYNDQMVAIVTSNKEFKEKSNPTWKLSKDKKTYMKILDDVTFPYTTTFTNVNGYSVTHIFE